MADLHGFPYAEVEFTKDGAVHDRAGVDALLAMLEQAAPTDLFVVSHGWNNDMAEARSLYDRLFAEVRAQLDGAHAGTLSGRRFAAIGVLWPSKKFAEEEQTAGGAAGFGTAGGAVLTAHLDELKALFDDPAADAKLDQAKELVDQLENDQAARDRFVALLVSLLPQGAPDAEDAEDALVSLSGDEILQRLSAPVLPAGGAGPTGSVGGASVVGGAMSGGAATMGGFSGAGGAASIGGPGASGAAAGFSVGGLVSGIKAGAQKLLNLTTYYAMKERAGTVGAGGANSLLREVRAAHPALKLHLIGHSFGGRLVAAATAGPDGQSPVAPATVTLLQAAFSHYGFARDYDGDRDGFFRRVVDGGMVSGPILITCTKNDVAVGKLYPLASQIAGQVASALGDQNDRYGGIGRNGAQKTPEAVNGDLLDIGGAYAFVAGKLHNLKADAFIGGHSDITKPQVAHAVLSAVAVT